MPQNTSRDDLAQQIADRLRWLRLRRKWTRENLAERANINVYTLKRFERTGQISLERLLAISEALDVVDELKPLFKIRERININDWKAPETKIRQRGRKQEKTNIDQDAL